MDMNPLVSFDDLSQSQINLIFSLPKRFSPRILFEISCGLSHLDLDINVCLLPVH